MRRSLTYYWRSHLAVLLGAAVAATVLTGALLVGDSVRGSLRSLLLDRLGDVQWVVAGERPFRERLAADLGEGEDRAPVAPALTLRGSVVHGETGARATSVSVFGVDERLLSLYPEAPSLELEERVGLFPPVWLNAALAAELEARPGDDLLLSLERPSDIPRETLVGRREATESVEVLRLGVAGVLPDRGLGGLALTPRQTRTLNAFVGLSRLQRALFGRDRDEINLVLSGSDPNGAPERLRRALRLEDLGVRLLPGEEVLTVQSREFVLRDAVAAEIGAAARELGGSVQPVLTYLANSLSLGGKRSIPYSTISALEPAREGPTRLPGIAGEPAAAPAPGEILLNAWAAEELGAEAGDAVELTYYSLGPRDELATKTARFTLRDVVAMEGLVLDPHLTPEFPGMQEAQDMSAWSPPFPLQLDRIRERDEEYWDEFRTAPKAFVSLEEGRELWRSRFGSLTSLRLVPPPGKTPEELASELAGGLRQRLDPAAFGLTLRAVREEGLRAARGATDFAGLFLALSFFLIASAALLVGLLFRLAVERRASEVGLLKAVGYRSGRVRNRLLGEGGLLAAAGSLLGVGGGVLYAWLLLAGLRTWWLPAAGAPVLFLHMTPRSLILGWGISVAVVLLSVWLGVRRLYRLPSPALLAGAVAAASTGRSRLGSWTAAAGLVLTAATAAWGAGSGQLSSPAVAFGMGTGLLVGGLGLFAWWLGWTRGATSLAGSPAVGMGLRNSARNWARSLLCASLVASACFVIVVVAANRAHEEEEVTAHDSGAGGFTLVAETDVPIVQDITDPEALGASAELVEALSGVEMVPFRLLPGDDVSCLNLYRPERPRLLGVPEEMIARGGFTFQELAEPREAPWTLLQDDLGPDVIPAFGDYHSVQWILHRKLGDEIPLQNEAGREVRLRLVGLLARTIFQSELLVSEEHFLRHFPSRTGYRVFLADPPPETAQEVSNLLEADLAPFGFDAVSTRDKLASFRAVENTYLSTFQTLGGLGIVLGTLGLGIVLLRNVEERRSELAALRAFGFRRATLGWMVLFENSALLLTGMAIGTLAGLVAVLPNLQAVGSHIPWPSLTLTLTLVLAVGTLSGLLAVSATLRLPLLPSLRAE